MTTATTGRSGWVTYAMTMFIVIGVLDIIYGLTMLINDEWVVFGADTVWYVDISVWGWVTLLLGVLSLAVASGISAGKTWAQILGVTAAVLAAINAFMVMPYYTTWGVVVLALSMLMIWALTVHGDEIGA